MSAIDATSASNAWAVGNSESAAGQFRAVILHWNGTAWKAVASPVPKGSFSNMLAVTATSASDAWAAAIYTTGVVPHTLLLHWNGSAWKIVNSGVLGGFLGAMASTSASRVWAVGDNPDSKFNGFDTLVIRWNGTTWQHVSTPFRLLWFTRLDGVAATSGSDAWAVGKEGSDALILHWNGTAWKVVR